MNDTPYRASPPTDDDAAQPLASIPQLAERPLVRVYTLGPFTLEWVGTPTPFPPERLQSRGAAPALVLLKALISRPHRCATNDWLREHLRSAEEEAMTSARLEDLASLLRGLLCPPMQDTARRDRLRLQLLTRVYGSSESGPGYRLGGYPLIWVDIDALKWSVEQACRLERFGEDALPFWERAYDLARRGEYLEEEPYSDWAETRRAEAARYLRQSVHALSRRYLRQPEARGEEEALRLLGDYWERHIEDEDALRPLMELLGKHERYQEALSYYARLCEVLEEEGRTPDARTTDLKEFLCAKQLQRSLPRAQVSERVLPVRVQDQPEWPASPAPMALPRVTRATLTPYTALDLLPALPESDFNDIHALGACFALSASDLGALLERGWAIEALLEVLQVILPVVKAMPAITRRTFLQAGAATIFGGLSLLERGQIPEEEVMQFCQAFQESIVNAWKLFSVGKSKQVLAISQAQFLLLQPFYALLPPQQQALFYSSLYNLMGIASCHEECYDRALDVHTKAYIAALNGGNALEVIRCLLCQANVYQASGQYAEARASLERAFRILTHHDDQYSMPTQAHLFGLWADNAMMMREYDLARQKLDETAKLLDPHCHDQEFDQSSWYELRGKYAYLTGDYTAAAHWYEQALQELPAEWVIRQALVLAPLISTYTILQDRDASLATVEKVAQIASMLNTSLMRKSLAQALEGILIVFPYEARLKATVSGLLQQGQPPENRSH
jgi:tetratricopeptide (TPR) repeat protein